MKSMKRLLAIATCVLLPKNASGFSAHRPAGVGVKALIGRRSVQTALSAFDSSVAVQTHQPVQRVAIIGAGIAGLALAHALLVPYGSGNNNIAVDIFDSRPDLDEKAGSGIQLTGGLVALNEISSSLYRKVADASLPLESVTSRCRPWFGTNLDGDNVEQGWKLLELDIQKAIRDDAAARSQVETEDGSSDHTLVTKNGEVVAYTILRGTLQRILHEELQQKHGVQVQFCKKLRGISYSTAGDINVDGIMCQFNNDGTASGPYDIVVGCDGIQSAVKQYVDTGDIKPIEKDKDGRSKSSSSAVYSGIRITFAIQDGETEESSPKSAQFTQFFGNGAYALSSSYGAGKGKLPAKGAFLIYADENYFGPFERKRDDARVVQTSSETVLENADWAQDNRVPREHISECLDVLQSASVPGNAVANVVQYSNRFFDLGVYFHNPFSWNGWMREVPNKLGKTGKYAILAGDAAHAMPPFLGQGGNQALQDAYVLASKIHKYNSQVEQNVGIASMQSDDATLSGPNLKALLKEYETLRWLPTASITAKAAFLGYLETGSGLFANFRDAFFFVMGKIGVAKKVFLDSANPKL